MTNYEKLMLKSHACYYFHDIIKFKDFDLDNILMDEKLYENILVYKK